MTAAEWADRMIARGNARGRAFRAIPGNNPDVEDERSTAKVKVSEADERVVLIRCSSCGLPTRGAADGFCERCRRVRKKMAELSEAKETRRRKRERLSQSREGV